MPAPLLSTLSVNGAQGMTDPAARSNNKTATGDEFGRIFQRQEVQRSRDSASSATSKQNCKNESPKESLQETPKDNNIGNADIELPDAEVGMGTKNSETQTASSSESDIEGVEAVISDGQNINDAKADIGLVQAESFPFWVHYVQAEAQKANGDSSDLEKPKTAFDAKIGDESAIQYSQQSLVPIANANVNVQSPLVKAEETDQGEIIFTGNQTLSLNSLNKESGSNKLSIQVPTSAEALQDTSGLSSEFSQLIVSQSPTAVNKSLIAEQPIINLAEKTMGELLSVAHTQDASAPVSGQNESKWLGQAEALSVTGTPAGLENKSFFQLRFNQQTLAQDLVEKTGWLIEHKLDTAQIQLDPPELGPITVKIHTHQDQVSVTFVVNNPQVRDAMDQTLQRLKDLLQDQGIMLSHADVNGQRQQRDNPQEEESAESKLIEADEEESLTLALPEIAQGVDHFV